MSIYYDYAPYINGIAKKRETPHPFSFLLNYFHKTGEILARIKRRLPRIRPGFILVIFIFLIALGGIYRLYGISKLRQPKNTESRDNVKFSQVIPVDKTLEVPALNSKGKYEGEISLRVVSAEKTNEVLVQNKPIRAKPDRFFLIVNLELENKSIDKLGLVSSDLARLVVGENGRKIAPDLHNRQVLIAPVSVKTDKVGFVVIGPQNVPLALELGEFYKTKEVKEKIELNFKPT